MHSYERIAHLTISFIHISVAFSSQSAISRDLSYSIPFQKFVRTKEKAQLILYERHKIILLPTRSLQLPLLSMITQPVESTTKKLGSRSKELDTKREKEREREELHSRTSTLVIQFYLRSSIFFLVIISWPSGDLRGSKIINQGTKFNWKVQQLTILISFIVDNYIKALVSV